MRTHRIRWNNREVENPILRPLVAVGAFVGLIVFAPIWLPLDWALKLTGRRGFMSTSEDGTFTVLLEPEGFRRV